jgi:hypothetical protein
MKSRTVAQTPPQNFKSSVESIESPNFRNTSDSKVDYPEDRFTSNNPQKSLKSKASLNAPKTKPSAQEYYQSDPELDFSPEVVITIALGAFGEKKIKCKLDDNPEIVAKNFCIEHGLAKEAAPVIIDMINKQFKILVKKKEKRSVPKKDPENFTFSPKVHETGNFGNLRTAFQQPVQDPNENRDSNTTVETQPKMSIQSSKDRLVGKLDINISPTQKVELCLYKDEDPVQVA